MATKKEPIQILDRRKKAKYSATFEYLVRWNDQSDDSWILESILRKQYPKKVKKIINEWKKMGTKKVRNKLEQEMRLWSELPYASHAPAKPSIFRDSDDEKLPAGESIEEEEEEGEEFPMSDLGSEDVINPEWIDDNVLGKRKRQYGGKTRKKRRKTRKKKRKNRKKKRKTRKKRRKKRRKTRKKKRR